MLSRCARVRKPQGCSTKELLVLQSESHEQKGDHIAVTLRTSQNSFVTLSIAYCSLFTFSDLLTDQSQISTSKEVATENASTYSDLASNCDTLAQMMDLFFHGTICTTERPTARECDRNAPCHSDRPRPKSAAERPCSQFSRNSASPKKLCKLMT